MCQPGQGRLGPTFPAGCCVHPTEYVRMCTLAWLKKVRSFGTRNVSGCVSTSSASLSGESSPVCGSSELGAGRLHAAQASTRLGSWVLAPRGLCARLRWLVRRARAPERLWAAQSRGRSPGQGQRSQRSRSIQAALSTHRTLRSCGAQRRRPRRDAGRGCRASGRARAAARATAGAPPPS